MILRQIIFFLTIGNLSTLHLYGAEFTKTVLPTLQKKCISCHREPYKTKYGRIKKPKGKFKNGQSDPMMFWRTDEEMEKFKRDLFKK